MLYSQLELTSNMEEEIWKSIKNLSIGYDGTYEASTLGRIRDTTRNNFILPYHLRYENYLGVSIRCFGRNKPKPVHQLVAIAFLNHVPCGSEIVVNHIDFSRQNNKLSNLELVTMRENSNRKHLKSSSKYTGVHWDKKVDKWTSAITVGRKSFHIGCFSVEEEASLWYEKAVIAVKNGTPIEKKKKISSSIYKGVIYCKRECKWIAKTDKKKNQKVKQVGTFNTEIEAHKARVAYLESISNLQQ